MDHIVGNVRENEMDFWANYFNKSPKCDLGFAGGGAKHGGKPWVRFCGSMRRPAEVIDHDRQASIDQCRQQAGPGGALGLDLQVQAGLHKRIALDLVFLSPALQQLDHKVVDGAWLDGDGRGIVLGVDLARTLSVGLGDRVVYMGQHGGATDVSSRLFRVKGSFFGWTARLRRSSIRTG